MKENKTEKYKQKLFQKEKQRNLTVFSQSTKAEKF